MRGMTRAAALLALALSAAPAAGAAELPRIANICAGRASPKCSAA